MESIDEILKSHVLPAIKERILPISSAKAFGKIKKTKPKRGAPPSGVVVFQHNNLVEANYRLSLQEKRVILWLASQVQPKDADFKEHILKIEDFIQIAGLTGESAYKEIKKITLQLIQRALTIHKLDKKEEVQVAWVSCAKYMHNEGRVALSFHPEMGPFLLELKGRFTSISLADLMQFSSIYAIRIYELLKQYENIGERIIEVDLIRKHCGVTTKLKQYVHFKEKILLIAQREINSKSDIEFTFEEIKFGRKITSIKFKILKNKTRLKEKSALQEINRLPSIYHILDEFGLSKRVIASIIRDNKEQDISNAIKVVELQIQRGNVKNPKAMLLKAIKEKWHPEIYKAKQK